MLSLVVLLTSSGIMFHNSRLMKNEAFLPALVLRNDCFSLCQVFLDDKLALVCLLKLHSYYGGIGHQSIL